MRTKYMMKTSLFWGSIIFAFILGLLFCITKPVSLVHESSTKEGMLSLGLSSKQKRMCGTLLVKEGNKIKLYNSNAAEVPGVNPIVFDDLADYAEFVKWLKSQGIQCPVLMLEESYDVQGNKTYIPNDDSNMRFLGAISDDLIQLPYEGNGQSVVHPIIDASRDNPPYNSNSYTGYDPLNQRIGKITKLDKEASGGTRNGKSPFPTDPNWGGPEYSQSLLDEGDFDEDKVFVRK